MSSKTLIAIVILLLLGTEGVSQNNLTRTTLIKNASDNSYTDDLFIGGDHFF